MADGEPRIQTMHAGSLPRPADLFEMIVAKEAGKLANPAKLDTRLREAVGEVVRLQAGVGLDSINDGEFGKSNFSKLRP